MKKGLITSKPTTHNARDMARIKKLKKALRHTYKEVGRIERQARHVKDACAKLLNDLDTGWEP